MKHLIWILERIIRFIKCWFNALKKLFFNNNIIIKFTFLTIFLLLVDPGPQNSRAPQQDCSCYHGNYTTDWNKTLLTYLDHGWVGICRRKELVTHLSTTWLQTVNSIISLSMSPNSNYDISPCWYQTMIIFWFPYIRY